MAKKPTDADAPAKITITVVSAQEQARTRAGIQFGRKPVTVDVTAEQREAIENDPVMAIVATPKPAEAAS